MRYNSLYKLRLKQLAGTPVGLLGESELKMFQSECQECQILLDSISKLMIAEDFYLGTDISLYHLSRDSQVRRWSLLNDGRQRVAPGLQVFVCVSNGEKYTTQETTAFFLRGERIISFGIIQMFLHVSLGIFGLFVWTFPIYIYSGYV